MDEQQLRSLSLEEVRRRMSTCNMAGADYHLLRRECQRRLAGWGKIANCAGCAMLVIVLLVLYAQWFLR